MLQNVTNKFGWYVTNCYICDVMIDNNKNMVMEKIVFENANCVIRKATPKPSSEIKPGAILSAAWGYEQTNYDFYIVKKVKNGWVTVVEVESESSNYDGQYMTSLEMPTFKEVGEPMRRKMKYGNGFKISSYKYASLWDGKPEKATHYA